MIKQPQELAFNLKFQGFTLVEMLVTMAIMGILFSLVMANLTNLIPKAMSRSAAELLIADLREQQIKAMMGYESLSGGASNYGIYFEEDQYILFTGDNFVVGQPENYLIKLQGGLIFSDSNFRNSSIVFHSGDGEVLDYDSENNQIAITNTSNNETTIIEINQLGVPAFLP